MEGRTVQSGAVWMYGSCIMYHVSCIMYGTVLWREGTPLLSSTDEVRYDRKEEVRHR